MVFTCLKFRNFKSCLHSVLVLCNTGLIGKNQMMTSLVNEVNSKFAFSRRKPSFRTRSSYWLVPISESLETRRLYCVKNTNTQHVVMSAYPKSRNFAKWQLAKFSFRYYELFTNVLMIVCTTKFIDQNSLIFKSVDLTILGQVTIFASLNQLLTFCISRALAVDSPPPWWSLPHIPGCFHHLSYIWWISPDSCNFSIAPDIGSRHCESVWRKSCYRKLHGDILQPSTTCRTAQSLVLVFVVMSVSVVFAV